MTLAQRSQRKQLARRVPPMLRRPDAAGEITPDQVADARKDLGRHLAKWRASAGLRQVDLANLIRYSRSQIANVEVGRTSTTRRFWQNADTALGAYGALLAVFDQAHALARDFHAQTDQARDRERQQAVPPSAPPTFGGAACQGGGERCGPAVVGRWTAREVRALREALRMTVGTFAEHLGTAIAAVSGWEHPTTPATPTLEAQSVLDQALTLADSYSKARFRVLLDNPDTPIPGAYDRPDTTGRTIVTPIHHAKRTRSTS